ncbi:hypothetical protein EON65_46820 [archaeon]|nr:MAG: hypothetical protein EON65_46820 [archaeon]
MKVEVKGSSSIKSLSSPFPRPPCLQINQGVLSVYDDWKAIQLAPKDRCPKGLVVLLHTCGYSGMECWRYLKDAGVPSQHTLPIESRIAHSLHSNGYMLLSLSSYVNQAKNKCWHSDDTPHVAKVIRAVHTNVTSQTNQVLPIYAIGIFKGGFYLGLSAWSLYATYKIKLDGIFIMNSGIWHKDYKKPQFPPVFFIDMNRNGLTALHNNKTVQEMIASGLRSVQYSSDPFPISDDYFFTQGVLSKIDSQTLFQALQADPKYLWPGSQILMIDPSENIHLKNFKALVTKALPEYASTDALKGTHSPLLQALRKAYGFRETNDEFIPQVSGKCHHVLLLHTFDYLPHDLFYIGFIV